MRYASMILREYSLGCTPRELYYKCEWPEIYGLMWMSTEHIFVQNKMAKEAQEKQKVKQDVESDNKQFSWKKSKYGKPIGAGEIARKAKGIVRK